MSSNQWTNGIVEEIRPVWGALRLNGRRKWSHWLISGMETPSGALRLSLRSQRCSTAGPGNMASSVFLKPHFTLYTSLRYQFWGKCSNLAVVSTSTWTSQSKQFEFWDPCLIELTVEQLWRFPHRSWRYQKPSTTSLTSFSLPYSTVWRSGRCWNQGADSVAGVFLRLQQ